MNVWVFHLLFVPVAVFPFIWLLWKKELRDAAVYMVLIGIAYLFFLKAVVSKPIVITFYIMKLFEALKGWWK